MKVAIIGQGYVGLTISAFAGKYFDVVGFDNNTKIVEQLNKGISHIEGVESSELRSWIKAGRYRATNNEAEIAMASAPQRFRAGNSNAPPLHARSCKVQI